MDGSANPYLMQAAILAAGMEGIASKRDPGKPLSVNMYETGARRRSLKRLPATLFDALRLLEKNRAVREMLGEELASSYLKLKMEEWRSYTSHLSEWERSHTLDC